MLTSRLTSLILNPPHCSSLALESQSSLCRETEAGEEGQRGVSCKSFLSFFLLLGFFYFLGFWGVRKKGTDNKERESLGMGPHVTEIIAAFVFDSRERERERDGQDYLLLSHSTRGDWREREDLSIGFTGIHSISFTPSILLVSLVIRLAWLFTKKWEPQPQGWGRDARTRSTSSTVPLHIESSTVSGSLN